MTPKSQRGCYRVLINSFSLAIHSLTDSMLTVLLASCPTLAGSSGGLAWPCCYFLLHEAAALHWWRAEGHSSTAFCVFAFGGS